jgi:hypothetical protein
MILKRYDSKRVKGWGSAKDMIPWELGGQRGRDIGGRARKVKAWRGSDLKYTGNNSRK